MEVKVQIDDAAIIRQVLQGCSTEEVHKRMVSDALEKIRQHVVNEVVRSIDTKVIANECSCKIANEFYDLLIKAVQKKYSSNADKFIKRLFEDRTFEEQMGQWLWDIISNHLDDGVSVSVQWGKKRIAKRTESKRR